MKKIAIITPGILPVPSLQGGAVEKLIDNLIDQNEFKGLLKIDVFSISPINGIKIKKLNSNYKYINNHSIIFLLVTFTFRLLNLITNNSFNNGFLFFVKLKLKVYNYDFVIVENKPDFILHLPKNYNNYILHLHNIYLDKFTYHNELILNKYKYIIVVSKFLLKSLSWYNNTNKISVLLNSIDIDYFLKREIIPKKFISLKRKYANFNIFLYVGRIDANKGFFSLIKAFNFSNTKNSILLLASGDLYNKKLPINHKAFVIKYIKSNNKIVSLGFINNRELKYVYKICDVVIIPTLFKEAAGLVALEASLMQKKIVTTYICGLPEYTFGNVKIIKSDDSFEKKLANIFKKQTLKQSLFTKIYKNTNQYSLLTYYNSFIDMLK